MFTFVRLNRLSIRDKIVGELCTTNRTKKHNNNDNSRRNGIDSSGTMNGMRTKSSSFQKHIQAEWSDEPTLKRARPTPTESMIMRTHSRCLLDEANDEPNVYIIHTYKYLNYPNIYCHFIRRLLWRILLTWFSCYLFWHFAFHFASGVCECPRLVSSLDALMHNRKGGQMATSQHFVVVRAPLVAERATRLEGAVAWLKWSEIHSTWMVRREHVECWSSYYRIIYIGKTVNFEWLITLNIPICAVPCCKPASSKALFSDTPARFHICTLSKHLFIFILANIIYLYQTHGAKWREDLQERESGSDAKGKSHKPTGNSQRNILILHSITH